jgi:hypothetical protein
MKKTLIALLLGAGLLAAQTQNAQAQRWVAPAVFGGLVTGAVVADALQPRPVYYPAATYYYSQPTTVYYTPGQSTYYNYTMPAPATPVVYQSVPYPYYYGSVVRIGWGWGWHHPYRR